MHESYVYIFCDIIIMNNNIVIFRLSHFVRRIELIDLEWFLVHNIDKKRWNIVTFATHSSRNGFEKSLAVFHFGISHEWKKNIDMYNNVWLVIKENKINLISRPLNIIGHITDEISISKIPESILISWRYSTLHVLDFI